MIALALLIATPQAFQPPKGQSLVVGFGNLSCATAWAPANAMNSLNWVLGFWSGINQARAAVVGVDTDDAGIAAEVQKVCAEHPSKPLLQATMQAYQTMSR